jgi:hypothetical protein
VGGSPGIHPLKKTKRNVAIVFVQTIISFPFSPFFVFSSATDSERIKCASEWIM